MMHRTISPAAQAGLKLFHQAALAGMAAAADSSDYKRYVCPGCAETHKQEDDAISCCPPDIDVVYEAPDGQTFDSMNELIEHMNPIGGSMPSDICPVCHNSDIGHLYEAASCCLWKDFAPAARWRLSFSVRDGKTWAQAIAEELAR